MCLARLAQIIKHINRKKQNPEKYKVIQVPTMIPIIFFKVSQKRKKKRKKKTKKD